ncbi:MAG: ribosome biogenesis GTPase Der [Opitutales bacterium]|nr:ribosome biogenesis GTPase Der [Opitutales bacterium]
MDTGKSIAIVGRPNVGKSRLFNRILKRRVSIVHDRPGVTRDIVAEKLPNGTVLMDTGGLGATEDTTEKVIAKATDIQAEFAMNTADIILFVVDSQEGLTPHDQRIADSLRKSGKQTALVVNKTDLDSHKDRNHDFYTLGFETFFVSAEHGLGMDSLIAYLEKNCGSFDVEPISEPMRVKICVAGKPNVGKSSIGNRLLGSQRLIVSDVAGTTRDSVKCDFLHTTKRGANVDFRFFDTAGLRAKRKINTSLDYLSTVRTKDAIAKCDVVMLVLDAMTGVTELDKKLAGEILDAGAAVMVLVNKWDLAVDLFKKGTLRGYTSIRDFRTKFEEAVRKELFFLEDAPISFVSAKNDTGLDTILDASYAMYKRAYKELPTGRLNSVVRDLVDSVPPKIVGGKRFKVYYCLQISNRPTVIRMYCNSFAKLDGNYYKYIEKNLRKTFSLGGVSLKFEFKGKESKTLQERLTDKRAKENGSKKGGKQAAFVRFEAKSGLKSNLSNKKFDAAKKLLNRKKTAAKKGAKTAKKRR